MEKKTSSKRGGSTCAMKDCNNAARRSDEKLSYFCFPKDFDRSIMWIRACGRDDLLGKDPLQLHQNYRVCSVHFTDAMFLNDLKNRLHTHAVPIRTERDQLSEILLSNTNSEKLHCVVKDCPSQTLPEEKRGSLFCFPQNNKLLSAWLKNLKLTHLGIYAPKQLVNKGFRVCHLHFLDNQFQNCLKKKLIFNVIPPAIEASDTSEELATHTKKRKLMGDLCPIPESSSVHDFIEMKKTTLETDVCDNEQVYQEGVSVQKHCDTCKCVPDQEYVNYTRSVPRSRQFFTEEIPMSSAELIRKLIKCINFAAIKHRNQRRQDTSQTPYINQVIGTAYILTEKVEIGNPNIIQAAFLHDTVGEPETSLEEIEEAFGTEVCKIIEEIMHNKTLFIDEQNQLNIIHRPMLSYEAKLIKLADKLYNLKDLEKQIPTEWTSVSMEDITLSSAELTRILIKCINFAAIKHRNQRRKDKSQTPYVNHVIGVAYILTEEAEIVNTNVITAALLHDTVGDTETSFEEIEKEFGAVVRKIVEEVTDNKTLSKDERKRLQIVQAPSSSYEAKLIKLADKLYNLRDLEKQTSVEWKSSKVHEYFLWCKKVVDGLRGTSNKLENELDMIFIKRSIL